MHNLLRLVVHLHLLLRIAIGLEHVNLGNHVISQLMRELLDGLHLAVLYHLLILLLKLSHSGSTGTRSTLIRRNMNALDVRDILQGLQHDHHHDCRAVRVGNDAAGTLQRILSITLRNNQGHIVVHTEGT